MRADLSKLISFIAIALMFLTACGGGSDPKPDPDNTNPTIETTLPAAAGQNYTMTGSFLYSGTFKDNEELKVVKFTLKHNKTTPSASLKVANGVDDPPWEPKENDFKVMLSGKEQELTNKELFGEAIPSGVWTGVYTLTITCTDKADNKAISTIDVTIQ